MGSIEVYDYNKRRWIPYVPDYKKWEQHFADVTEGRVHPDHKGRYIVGKGSRLRSLSDNIDVNLVSPVAQSLEMAKSELKRERQKVIRERVKKPRTGYNQLKT